MRSAFLAAGRLFAGALALAASPVVAEWREKVDPRLLARLAGAAHGEAEFLVVLEEQADLSPARNLGSKLEKGRFVFESLTATAERSQGPLRAELAQAGIEYRPYWIVNMIQAKGDLGAVASVASRWDVARIDDNSPAKLDGPVSSTGVAEEGPEGSATIEWNILRVNADDVWLAGFTGAGAVIGAQDTGYAWEHPALKAKYRGWNGATADHDYNWHDSIHSAGSSCGPDVTAPCDDHGHGTHTQGTMLGDDGAGNQIGMAPGAKWIGCRNMNAGDGTPATYAECYQWFVAPTEVGGANPDPAMAPHVINNSWGCPGSEGCNAGSLLTATENLRAAGIFTAHSAGNSGSSCSTVSTPSGIYDASFTVGSITEGDMIWSSSSRGPVTVDGSNRRKPDIAAPGACIRSSLAGGGFGGHSPCTWSGTSMAAPHLAGLVALLISAEPALAGQVDALEELIRESAIHLTTSSQVCGSIAATTYPNNTFGFGLIDAQAAVELLQSGFLFRDGFETRLTDDWSATVLAR